MTGSTQYFVPERLYTPDCPAVVHGARSISYAQLFKAVSDAESNLQRLGVRSGDRAGIFAPNNPEYIITLLALWRIGAVACLLSTRLPNGILNEQLRSINCRYFFTLSRTSTIVDIKHIHLNDIISIQTEVSKEENDNIMYALDQEATILFTSGSAAQSKAALHTLENHFYSAKGANEHIPLIPGDQWLLSLPLYHVGGLSILFRTFLGGGSIVISDPKDNIEMTLMQHDITHISLVPTQLIRLLRNKDCLPRLKNLKAILLGGSPIPDSLIRNSIENGLPVYTTYGLTEMASQVATSSRLTAENKRSSAKILNYRKLMISEENEIFVKGEALFKGYIEDSRLSFPFNANGYFATGDLGCFSDDGNLIVTGRKDNMFISGGENIHPEEIECYLYQMEGIEQVIVVPVVHNEYGLRPVAIVKPASDSPITSQKIILFLKDRLPKYKIPDQFYSWPGEMESGSLKADRQQLIRLVDQENRELSPLY